MIYLTEHGEHHLIRRVPDPTRQAKDRLVAGERWTETGVVFTTRWGLAWTPPTSFATCAALSPWCPGLNPADWTPRELRHSFVSLLSDAGVHLEDIAQLVGHSGTTVTKLVYRHRIRPVIQAGATVMDRLFAPGTSST
jgi:integrase